MRTHKDLDVWKESMKLVVQVYNLTKTFPQGEIYTLVSQTRRYAISIPSNIAEGAARNSRKEFIQFLYVALGSLAELETQLLLAKELGYIKNTNIDECVVRQRKMMLGLLKYLKQKQINL